MLKLQDTAKHCNSLQHTATHCNTLHRTATHCTALQHTAPHSTTLQHSVERALSHAPTCPRESVSAHTLFEPPLESDWISNFQMTHSIDISLCITHAHTCTHTQCLFAPLDAWLSSWCFRSLLTLWDVWLKHTYTHTSVFSRHFVMAHWVREF